MEVLLNGRTYYSWLEKDIDNDIIVKIYELMKFGPTSFNGCPIRIIFIKSKTEKDKIIPFLNEGNRESAKAAPVIAILSYDLHFYKKLDFLFPFVNAAEFFKKDKELSEITAFRNGTLQAGYFILAARSLGLDVGPISGFDEEKVQKTFLKDTTYKVNFICNLGYGNPKELENRLPRPNFEEVCSFV